jgi:hypothetical protein
MLNGKLKLFSICLSITFACVGIGSGLHFDALTKQPRQSLFAECLLASTIGATCGPRLIRWLDATLPTAPLD